MAAEAGFDMKIRVTEFATSLKQAEDGDYQAFCWLERPHRSRRQQLHLPQLQRAAEQRRLLPIGVDKALDDARLVTEQAERKAIYEKVDEDRAGRRPMIYLYHRLMLIAHTTKLEGYKQMPDGLVRVVGLKLK